MYFSRLKLVTKDCMIRPIVFGEIEALKKAIFEGRKEMMPSGFHRKWGAGIDGNAKDGVAAIVLSGGYEDDLDSGDEIIYTGAGGNDGKENKLRIRVGIRVIIRVCLLVWIGVAC